MRAIISLRQDVWPPEARQRGRYIIGSMASPGTDEAVATDDEPVEDFRRHAPRAATRLLDQLEDLTLGGRALVVEGDHRIVVVPALHVPGVDQRLSVDAKDGIRHDVDRATGHVDGPGHRQQGAVLLLGEASRRPGWCVDGEEAV